MQTLVNTADLKAINKVRDFCIAAHESIDQKYGDKDYSYHLRGVASVVHQYKNLLPKYEQRVLAEKGAWAHDLLEDVGSLSYNDVTDRIGGDVAEISFLLQTPKGRNRTERHCDAYYRDMAVDVVAVLIKIADRMNNVYNSMENYRENPEKDKMLVRYISEREHFQKIIRPAFAELEPMWRDLDSMYDEGSILMVRNEKAEASA
jgi:(p)ppGpp synthase/HD superfamily hydrolase